MGEAAVAVQARGAAGLTRLQLWLLPPVLLVAAVGAHLVDPEAGELPLACPFKLVTGLHCPGCGVARAAHRAATGDLLGAISFNPLAAVVAAVGLVWLVSAYATAAGWRREPWRVPPVAVRALPWVVGGFWVLRNVPVAPFTLLAP